MSSMVTFASKIYAVFTAVLQILIHTLRQSKNDVLQRNGIKYKSTVSLQTNQLQHNSNTFSFTGSTTVLIQCKAPFPPKKLPAVQCSPLTCGEHQRKDSTKCNQQGFCAVITFYNLVSMTRLQRFQFGTALARETIRLCKALVH